MNKFQIILFAVIISVLFSCSKDEPTDPEPTDPTTEPMADKPNVLLIIADDLGKDAINGYTEGSIKPNTPHIDAIRNNGLTFNNLWVHPTCSPTRSAIITGKYGYRTGVKGASDQLSSSETTLHKYISDETNDEYASALIGKWHLSGNNTSTNPETFGISYYIGLIRGAVDDYLDWPLSESGSNTTQTDYITETFTDKSIDWIADQTQPWFLWLAYTAPHTPFHSPPSNMHSQGDLAPYTDSADPIPYFMAAIEAMDFQIGRLLESMTTEERDKTIIIFLGDNGTPNKVAQSPYSRTTVKNTLYQGGINTPLFISGNGVTRTGTDDNLITSTDLFATIAEITGSTTTSIHDSQSFKSLFTTSGAIRDFQYSEMDDGTTNAWAISNGTYKLIVNANGTEELYDLSNDPYEGIDLLLGTLSAPASSAKQMLEAELSVIRN